MNGRTLEQMQHAYVVHLYDRALVWWSRLRMRAGCWLMGGDYHGIVMRLWLVRDRAMKAVSADGMVTLADCPALAEVLYEPMPGKWSMTVTRKPESADEFPSDSEGK